MKKMNKNIKLFSRCVLSQSTSGGMKHVLYYLGAFLFPFLALAAEPVTPGTYTLMAPLTGELGTGSAVDLTTYLSGVVQLIIGLAGILAVIMIVVCGIKLMGSPSASARSEAKECIWNAIFGVLLAIGAWILLYTINPLLLTNQLNLGNVPVTGTTPAPSGPSTDPYPTKPGWYFKYSDATGIHYNPPGGTSSAATCAALVAPAEAAGKTIIPLPDGQICFQVTSTPLSASEEATRIALCGNKSCVRSTPIGINTGACQNVGDEACTNVGGLGAAAVSAIQALPAACGCSIIISGGTEYWLHGDRLLTPPNTDSAHAPGNDVFDLKQNAQLDALIKTGVQSDSFNKYTRWLYNGFWYTLETKSPSHWHVCRNGLSASYCRT